MPRNRTVWSEGSTSPISNRIAVIRKSGNLIDVTLDGSSPTPPDIAEVLSNDLCYMHKTYLRGQEAYDYYTDQHMPVRIDRRAMYCLSPDGKFTTQSGFMSRVCRLLENMGYQPRLCDLSPPRRRPECYVPNFPELTSRMTLRTRQDECLANMLTAINQKCGGIIWAPPGFGKTHLFEAMNLLHPKARTDIIVKPCAVAKRIYRQLSRSIPDVGRVGDGYKQPNRVTVVTADSMHHRDGDVDFMLADEVHQLLSDRFAERLATIYRNSINFGSSASPYSRSDGAHARLEGLFGPTLFRMTYPEAVELGLVVPIRVRWLPVQMSRNPASGKKDVAKKRHGIWRNTTRNNILAAAARTYEADRQVLILVETVEHAVYLRQMLPEFQLCYADLNASEFAEYVERGMLSHNEPRMTSDRRESLRSSFEQGTLKKVIATDVWSTGVDFEQLDVLIRADARGSEIMDIQGPGRATRIYDGKAYGEVIDTVDYFDESFMAKSRGRHRSYASMEWSQDWPATNTRGMPA